MQNKKINSHAEVTRVQPWLYIGAPVARRAMAVGQGLYKKYSTSIVRREILQP